VKIPIHPELEEHLISGPLSDNPDAPLFPELHQKPGSGKSGCQWRSSASCNAPGLMAAIIRERRVLLAGRFPHYPSTACDIASTACNDTGSQGS